MAKNVKFLFMIQNSKFNSNGFTLIEILVSLGIFSLVIMLTVGIFVSGSVSQRKIIELHMVQREGGYIMETVSRELRMATGISITDSDNQDGASNDIGQQNNNNSSIEFTNYNGDLVRYCRADEDGSCNAAGNFLSREVCMVANVASPPDFVSVDCDSVAYEERISSSDAIIENLIFYTSETFSQTQPIIMVSMKIKSTSKYSTELTLQNSVVLRIY